METTEGKLAALAGSPAGARVSLIPASFDPRRGALPESLTTMADAQGNFRFHALSPGQYNLEAWQPMDGSRSFQIGITLHAGPLALLPTDTLLPPGRLRLHWDGARRGILFQKGRVFRYELEGLRADSGSILIDSLPAGLLPPFSFSPGAQDTAYSDWTDSVEVDADSLDDVIAYDEWTHRARLTVAWPDSSAARNTPDGFPMLVRLARPGFDFSEALAHGEDLRFTTLQGFPLAYAIERWDTAAGLAEIWVRNDSLDSGEAGRSFLMYWGNANAEPEDDDCAVFDTAMGFAAVWHLAEPNHGGQGSIWDMTCNALDGPSEKLVADSSAACAIGVCQAFDGNGAYAYAQGQNLLQGSGPLLLSAWIAPDFAPDEGVARAILSKWDEKDSSGYLLAFSPDAKGLRLTLGLESAGGSSRIVEIDAAGLAFAPGEWHHVAAAYDGADAILYWDGQVIGKKTVGPGDIAANLLDVVIGARDTADPEIPAKDFFKGRIDETRIIRWERPASWVELEYLTQKPHASLIRFQALE